MPRGSKDNNSKISGVTSTETVKHLDAVSKVEKAEKTSAVSAIKGVGGTNKTRSIGTITEANREALYKMLHEEADKLFANGKVDSKKRQIIEKAVQMALDAAIADENNKTTKEKNIKK